MNLTLGLIGKPELCKLAGMYRRKLDRLMAKGQVAYYKVGQCVLFKIEDVRHLLRDHIETPPTGAVPVGV